MPTASAIFLLSEVKLLSHVRLLVTPWTVVYQAPQSMEFSRQEYWSGLPFPSPGDLPNPGIKPRSPTLQADALLSEPPGKPHIPATRELIFRITTAIPGFPGDASGKKKKKKKPPVSAGRCKRRGFDPWVGKIPLRRAWQPTLVFLPGKSCGQRILAGCSP